MLTIESANENACTHVCDVIILRMVPLRLIPLGLSRAWTSVRVHFPCLEVGQLRATALLSDSLSAFH